MSELSNAHWAKVIFLALLAVSIAFCVRYLLLGGITTATPYITFYPAVLIAALFGGFASGFIATILSAVLVLYFFIDPVGSFYIEHTVDILGLITFLAGCAMTTVAGGLMLRYRKRLEKQAATLIDLNNSLRLEIAERQEAEETHKELEIRIQQITDAANDAIVMINPEGRVTFWNLAAERILGYPAKEALGINLHELIAPKRFHQEFKDAFPLFKITGKGNAVGKTIDLFASRKDGVEIPVSLSLSALNIQGGWHGIGIVRDITDRKLIEDDLLRSRRDLKAVLDNLPSMIGYWDRELRNRFANHAYMNWFGIDPASMSGMHLKDVVGEERFLLNLPHIEGVLNGVPQLFERTIPSLEGKGLLYSLAHYIPDVVEDEVQGFYALVTDITFSKQAEEAMAASLQEKETLLREIHHRVKNNLQIISSLLTLQEEYVSNPEALDALAVCRGRVASMSAIHEQLYRSPNLSRVELSDYLHQFLPRIVSTFKGTQDISLELDIAPISLTLDQAIPLGLIVNELATNAVKHAFRDKGQGTINVSASLSTGQVTLMVKDEGAGLPMDFDISRSTSLGLQIVTMLTNQLHGSLTVESSVGSSFKVQFPLR